ncbi:hypothetical protein VTK26DRAFT_3790 [Humicola hyalothermophila]
MSHAAWQPWHEQQHVPRGSPTQCEVPCGTKTPRGRLVLHRSPSIRDLSKSSLAKDARQLTEAQKSLRYAGKRLGCILRRATAVVQSARTPSPGHGTVPERQIRFIDESAQSFTTQIAAVYLTRVLMALDSQNRGVTASLPPSPELLDPAGPRAPRVCVLRAITRKWWVCSYNRFTYHTDTDVCIAAASDAG